MGSALRIYRIYDDILGARDFAEWLELGGAAVSVMEDGNWIEVYSNASDELVHEAMSLTSWTADHDGPIIEVQDHTGRLFGLWEAPAP